MRKKSRIAVIMMLALAIAGGHRYVSAKEAVNNSDRQKMSLRDKARYYFLQGSIEVSQQNTDRAYEYFKKAYEIDPDFQDAAFTYGSQRLFVRTDTLQSEDEIFRSLKMMQGYVDINPKDLYATQVYGYLATALDTVEESVRVYENTYNLLPKETHLLQMLADSYMRRMDTKKALESLEKYEGIEGKSKDVSLKKITILLAAKDTMEAKREVERLIRSNPRDPYSLIMKGNLYEVTGDKDSVIKAYKEAEALAPDNGNVKMSLAQYYRSIGDSVMLDNKMYEALLSEDFELEDKLGILGEYLQKLLDEEGDRTRGDHLFSVLQSQYPHEPQVLEMSARYSGAKGDYARAAEEIRYAIDMDPTNETYWLMLMSYQLTDQKYADAVESYEEAEKVMEPTLRMKNLYGSSASMLDDKEKAEKILQNLIDDISPELRQGQDMGEKDSVRRSLDYDGLQWVSSLYCMLGDLHYKSGEPEKAFEEYETSLYFLSDNPLTLNNYAYFLSEEDKDLEKAQKMSRRVLELVENNPTYLDTYAWILYKLGEYKEALEYIELALDLAREQGDDNDEYQKHYEAIKEKITEE